MNISNMAHAIRVADQEARHSGFADAAERERAQEWLQRHAGKEKLLIGIAGLLRKLDSLPKNK